jgi:cytochrome d ubiquinol oxidase subunit II
MLTGAAAALFPALLPAAGTDGPDIARDITIDRALSSPYTLRIGLAWWSVGICLAILYFVIVYWLFRGKVPTDLASYEHE